MSDFNNKCFIKKFISLFRKDDETSVSFKRRQAKKLDGKHIRYAVERFENEELIIGRNGHLNISPNQENLLLTSGIETLFSVKIDEMTAGELLSHDGVILQGIDLKTGKYRKIVAYYKYYR